MGMVAIVAHVPLRAAAGIRVQTAAAVGIPLRGAVGIQVPIVAVVDIPLRAAAGAAGIQLPVAVEVAVGSTPPAVTTGPIADNKNLKYFRAAPQAAPFFVSRRIVSESGYSYQHVTSERPDLETVFLSLTGRNLRDS